MVSARIVERHFPGVTCSQRACKFLRLGLVLGARFAYRDAMFHPVPRVDRWEPLIAAAVAAVLAVALAAAAFLR